MALIITSVSCQSIGASPPRLFRDEPPLAHQAARELRSACALAEDRCSRCHPIDRVVFVDMATPRQWQDQVARMRRLAGSSITPADGDAIVRCLVYRSFGPAGLTALADGSKGTTSP